MSSHKKQPKLPSQENKELTMEGKEEISKTVKYPCGVCDKGVGANSIKCKGCQKWCHKRCSGLKNLKGAGEDFECPTCGRAENENKKNSDSDPEDEHEEESDSQDPHDDLKVDKDSVHPRVEKPEEVRNHAEQKELIKELYRIIERGEEHQKRLMAEIEKMAYRTTKRQV